MFYALLLSRFYARTHTRRDADTNTLRPRASHNTHRLKVCNVHWKAFTWHSTLFCSHSPLSYPWHFPLSVSFWPLSFAAVAVNFSALLWHFCQLHLHPPHFAAHICICVRAVHYVAYLYPIVHLSLVYAAHTSFLAIFHPHPPHTHAHQSDWKTGVPQCEIFFIMLVRICMSLLFYHLKSQNSGCSPTRICQSTQESDQYALKDINNNHKLQIYRSGYRTWANNFYGLCCERKLSVVIIYLCKYWIIYILLCCCEKFKWYIRFTLDIDCFLFSCFKFNENFSIQWTESEVFHKCVERVCVTEKRISVKCFYFCWTDFKNARE